MLAPRRHRDGPPRVIYGAKQAEREALGKGRNNTQSCGGQTDAAVGPRGSAPPNPPPTSQHKQNPLAAFWGAAAWWGSAAAAPPPRGCPTWGFRLVAPPCIHNINQPYAGEPGTRLNERKIALNSPPPYPTRGSPPAAPHPSIPLPCNSSPWPFKSWKET